MTDRPVTWSLESAKMPALAYAVVLAAILLPAILYFKLAMAESRNVKSLDSFFPLTRFLDSGSYAHSTVASGLSLATVILALVNLAPFVGISLIVTIASYAAGFVVLFFAAPAILRFNPGNQTLQGFLGTAYESSLVKAIAVAFTFVGYISIFAMELLVGVSVLKPFLGNWALAFSMAYLLFIIGYSILAGFRAVVATEQWHFRFIIVGVAVLPMFLILLIARSTVNFSLSSISGEIFGTWAAPWSFVVGIVAMNLPAAISDSGTWQRLCSTRSDSHARKGLSSAIPWFLALWGSMIVFSCYISKVAMHSHSFDPAKGTLMDFIISSLAGGGVIGVLILGIFMLGLFAAMITTADSLLLVAAQMLVIDVMKLDKRKDSRANAVRLSRVVLAAIAVLSFVVFSILHLSKFDIVQLIFAIYGAQLALFPAVAAALFLQRWLDLKRACLAAVGSVAMGFGAAWGSAIYGKFFNHMDWVYNAPAAAFAVACAAFLLLSIPAWRKREPKLESDVIALKTDRAS